MPFFTGPEWGFLGGLATVLLLLLGVKGYGKLKSTAQSYTKPYPGDGNDG